MGGLLNAPDYSYNKSRNQYVYHGMMRRWTKALRSMIETTLLVAWQILLIMLLSQGWTKALLVYSELGLMSIPTVMLLLLLSNSPAGSQLLLSNTPAGDIFAIPPMTVLERKILSIPTVMLLLLLLLSNSLAGPQLLLSNTPAGEIAVIPPMTAVERKMYTTTITSRQRPPLNNFLHVGDTAASD